MKFIKFIFFIIVCLISLGIATFIGFDSKTSSNNSNSQKADDKKIIPNDNLKFKIKFNLSTTINNLLPKTINFKIKYKTYDDVFEDVDSIKYLNQFFHYTSLTKIKKDHIIFLMPNDENTLIKIYRTSSEFNKKYFTSKNLSADLAEKIVTYYARYDININEIYIKIKKLFKSVYEKEFYKEALPFIIC
ncbi:hypothetical protein [Spiroplasma endosymbiont of Crioceris asparagi]|uniref:hypothetical protein n=1 Tax=Spiroplasma endosymbiont of Crioceris asparagi TaxID=3066286 RepID=UPI0030D30A3F